MAYLLDIKTTCEAAGCCSRASVELRDWLNESRGQFCKKHGKQKLAERNRFEKENHKLRGRL